MAVEPTAGRGSIQEGDTASSCTTEPQATSAWVSLGDDAVPVRRQVNRREAQEREERLRLLAPLGRRAWR